MAESGKQLQERQSKDVGARGFVEMRRLASMLDWAKNARINSSGVIGRGCNLPWSLLDEKQSGELASLVFLDQSPEFGRRMSWLWAARRALETMDTRHRVRRAFLAEVRASSYNQGIETGEKWFFVWRKVKKNRTDARTALVTHRWHGPAIVVGKEKNNVFVSYHGRLTKVAPECLRKASVAEQMSWDITTKGFAELIQRIHFE